MAGRIFVTGDCHQDFKCLNVKNFPEKKMLTKDDYLIICGDFGLIWSNDLDNRNEKYWLRWFDEQPWTTLFVDGNHENFTRLDNYEETSMFGGSVHRITPSIIHLLRGQIYTIAGRTFFTFGGAESHDMQGGILDVNDPEFKKKKKYLDKEWIPYRIENVTWWKREMPSVEEMMQGKKKLNAVNNQVEYIITHCCASETQEALVQGLSYECNELTDFLQEIKEQVQFKHWYFGHYHADMDVSEKETLIYDKIIELPE